jgi:hypothetical protein
MTRWAFALSALALASCSSLGSPPVQPDPNVMARIATACMGSGLFKVADGTLAAFVPATALPAALINAGVDQVCANPAQFAANVTTVEWLVRTLAAAGHSPVPLTPIPGAA